MSGRALRADPAAGFTQLAGVGGIGSGAIIALHGDHTLGRNESRAGELLDARDYCKLHIVAHYVAMLMGCKSPDSTFRVLPIGNVGNDAEGAALLGEMNAAGMDTRHVEVDPRRKTLFSTCLLYSDKSSCNVTVSNSAASAIDSRQLTKCTSDLAAVSGRGIALCLPEIPLDARRQFLSIATMCGSFRPASFTAGEAEAVRSLDLLSQVDLLALNREETAALGDVATDVDQAELLDACSRVMTRANPRARILSTAGSDGAFVFAGGIWSYYRALPAQLVSSAGAGDALLAGTLAGLAAGLPLTHINDEKWGARAEIRSAVGIGLLLAAFSVTSPHTIHPEADLDVLSAFARKNKVVIPEQFFENFATKVSDSAS